MTATLVFFACLAGFGKLCHVAWKDGANQGRAAALRGDRR